MADNEDKPKGFIIRCYKFFGLKPGQTRAEFAAEIRELSDKDKQDLVDEFNKAGMPTELATA